MSFAAVLELVTLVSYLVVILGGKQKRETGWKVLTFLLMLVAIIQCAAMAIVVSDPCWFRTTLADNFRHISTTMMTDSLRVGSWIKDGFFARYPGALLCFRLDLLLFRHLCSLQRVVMSSFRASVMEDSHRRRVLHAFKESITSSL